MASFPSACTEVLENSGNPGSWIPALNALALGPMAVVVSWAFLLAEIMGLTLVFPEACFLASGIWLGYTADRWCDCRKELPRGNLERRHHWFWRHRNVLVPAWPGVLLGSAGGAWIMLNPSTVLLGLGLAGLALFYTVVNSLEKQSSFTKGLKTALLLTLAVALFSHAHLAGENLLLLPPLALLFFSNCRLVASWESGGRAIDRPRQVLQARGLILGAGVGFFLLLFLADQPVAWILAGLMAALFTGISTWMDPLPHRRPLANFLADAQLVLPPLLLLIL